MVLIAWIAFVVLTAFALVLRFFKRNIAVRAHRTHVSADDSNGRYWRGWWVVLNRTFLGSMIVAAATLTAAVALTIPEADLTIVVAVGILVTCVTLALWWLKSGRDMDDDADEETGNDDAVAFGETVTPPVPPAPQPKGADPISTEGK